MTTEKRISEMTPDELRAEVERVCGPELDAYQADLEAALLNKPFPKGGPAPLDLTPPDENDKDVFGDE